MTLRSRDLTRDALRNEEECCYDMTAAPRGDNSQLIYIHDSIKAVHTRVLWFLGLESVARPATFSSIGTEK